MSEKKCSCEGQMIAALIAGAVLMLTVGFVLGWAWDKRQGVLGDVSILEVMTAFGTVGAAVGAAWSVFYTVNEKRKSQRHKDKVLKIQLDSNFFDWDLLVETVHCSIEDLLTDGYDNHPESLRYKIAVLERAVVRIRELEVVSVSDARLSTASEKLYLNIVNLIEEQTRLKNFCDRDGLFASHPVYDKFISGRRIAVILQALDAINSLLQLVRTSRAVSLQRKDRFDERILGLLRSIEKDGELPFIRGLTL